MNNSRNIAIAKPLWFDNKITWVPPDTDDLHQIHDNLEYCAKRIWMLRQCILNDYGKEAGRVQRLLRSRKKAIEKAYKKGLNARQRHRRNRQRIAL